MMKEFCKIVLISTVISILLIIILNKTTALNPVVEFNNNQIIEYSIDESKLYNNIYNFIEKNDNLLIALSSYETSNNLNENYEFLKLFAINYIIDNKEKYENIINNNLINEEEIYRITDNIFGRNYFYISDNKKIELIKDNRRFNMKIKDLKVNYLNDCIETIVDYKDIKYKYILLKKEDRLVIKNIEVL